MNTEKKKRVAYDFVYCMLSQGVSCHTGSCNYSFTATFQLKQTELFMKHHTVRSHKNIKLFLGQNVINEYTNVYNLKHVPTCPIMGGKINK